MLKEQYWTAGDARVRSSHRALHSKVFSTETDLWKRYAPPLGFNCRCSMTTLSARQLNGARVTDQRVPAIEADPGFWSHPPGPIG